MKEPWIALIGVLCNVSAQLAMKHGGREQQVGNTLMNWVTPWLLLAVVLYGLSFLLTVRVFAANPLSIASPAMAGGTFVLVALASCFLLGEGMGYQKLMGIAFIFLGIALLARS